MGIEKQTGIMHANTGNPSIVGRDGQPPVVAPKDTPATQVPDDLIAMYERLQKFRLGGLACILTSMDAIELIERIGRAEAALREHHLNAISEDQAYQGSEMYERTVAALATTPSMLKTGR